jgi:hypothetical protein
MVISPGRRVFRRVTRCHRLGLVARLRPTHQAGGHGQAGTAWRVHRTPPRSGPPGHGLDAANGPRRNGRRVLDHTLAPGRQAGTRPRPPYARRRVPPCPSAGQPLPGAAQDISGNAGMCSSTAMPRAAWALAGLAQQQSGWSRGHEQSGRGRNRRSHPNCYLLDARGQKSTVDRRCRWSEPVWSPPPESNRRPHPYHESCTHRCTKLRLCRSPPTVDRQVVCST